MVKLYADNTLVYTPFLDGHELQGLTATVGVNKGGTAEIVLPPDHPCRDVFTSYKTIVTVYRGSNLVFRGRALYPADDFYGTRTITCEGERCFLRDAIVRPYLWTTDPATIFNELITLYNAQVDEFKQFVVGEVTVTDPNDYVRLEGEDAATVADVLDKLVERCGGYIVFTTNDEGKRVINWLVSSGGTSTQKIEFGENLLDYASSGENNELATRIIPYGAKDEETGKRVTIESVNDGLDYVQDDDVIAIRGLISAVVNWDDVTLPENLLTKAKAELDVRKLIVTTLTISAVDMSLLDKDIDTFEVGESVHVLSTPHGVNSYFTLTERKYDLLDPGNDTVTMGKELITLTGAGVSDVRNMQTQLGQTASNIRTEVKSTAQSSASAAVGELAVSLQPKVNTSDAYMTSDGLMFQWGTLTMAAGTTSPTRITFAYLYEDIPSVQVTPVGVDPAKALCCVDGVAVDGVDVYFGPDVTTVDWLAIGKATIQ